MHINCIPLGYRDFPQNVRIISCIDLIILDPFTKKNQKTIFSKNVALPFFLKLDDT